jgi:hypothetical protein
MTISPREARMLAKDIIDLFLEYRDKHGYSDEEARRQVTQDAAEAYAFDPRTGELVKPEPGR